MYLSWMHELSSSPKHKLKFFLWKHLISKPMALLKMKRLLALFHLIKFQSTWFQFLLERYLRSILLLLRILKIQLWRRETIVASGEMISQCHHSPKATALSRTTSQVGKNSRTLNSLDRLFRSQRLPTGAQRAEQWISWKIYWGSETEQLRGTCSTWESQDPYFLRTRSSLNLSKRSSKAI